MRKKPYKNKYGILRRATARLYKSLKLYELYKPKYRIFAALFDNNLYLFIIYNLNQKL